MPDAPGRSFVVTADSGLSAYQVALKHGFIGTEQQWLDSLTGATGQSKGFTNRGDWVTGTTYNPSDYVFDDGSVSGTSIWVVRSTIAFLSTLQPKDDLSNWYELFVNLSGYVPTTTRVDTQYSLTGGGDLSTNRTLNLVGDAATPGNLKLYGTNGGGTKGWYDQPTGVPTGGTTNQFLAKLSNTDFDVDWVDETIELPSGGTTAQILAKASNTDYDVEWVDEATGLPVGGNTGQILAKASGTDYDVEWVEDVVGGGETGSRILSGGQVAWTGTGLDYIVSAAVYLINGTEYSSAETPITLDPADPSDDRIDVFALTDSGTATNITGTPGGPPVEPQVDPVTQLRVTFAYVPAGSTTPLITTEDIYLENTEWVGVASAGSINPASTNNPYAGTKDIEGTAVAAGVYVTCTRPAGTIDLSQFANLVLQIRSKASWPNNKSLSVFWLNASSVVVGSAVGVKTGVFGFDSSITATYQQVVIPLSLFGTGTTVVNKLRIAVAGGGAAIGWYIDNISVQSALTSSTGGDFSTNTTVSVVGEVVQFADTTGKLGKRSTGTGVAKLTSGVMAAGSVDLSGAEATGILAAGRFPALTNDVTTVAGALAATIANNAVTLAKMADIATDSILGRATAGTGDPEVLTALPFAFTGDVTRAADSNAQVIPNDTVTYAKIQNVSTDIILGRATAGSGDIEELAALPFALTGGDVTSPADSNVLTIANDAVTYAKFQNSPSDSVLLGRGSASGAGDYEPITLGTNLSMSGTTINAAGGTIISNLVFGLKKSSGVVTGKLPGYWTCPFAGTITAWNLTVDTGTITVKIWKIATGTAHPTVADSINTSGISLSSGTSVHSTSLGDFTTVAVSVGDIFAVEVTAVTGVLDFGGSVEITRS